MFVKHHDPPSRHVTISHDAPASAKLTFVTLSRVHRGSFPRIVAANKCTVLGCNFESGPRALASHSSHSPSQMGTKGPCPYKMFNISSRFVLSKATSQTKILLLALSQTFLPPEF